MMADAVLAFSGTASFFLLGNGWNGSVWNYEMMDYILLRTSSSLLMLLMDELVL
jgi:hypothetical protein